MRRRLIYLLEKWAEAEMIKTQGRGLRIPADTYVWIRDPLGRWHHGSYDGRGGFVPLQAAFTWISGTAKPENSTIDEFGVAFRALDEIDQALIVVGHFGSMDEWAELIRSLKLSRRISEAKLGLAWTRLLFRCKRRGLI